MNTEITNSFENFKSTRKEQRIAVIALGGAGNNAMVDIMCRPELRDVTTVDFYAANTDYDDLIKVQQATSMEDSSHLILLGPKVTGGNGAGGDPEVGYAAAVESKQEIQMLLQDYSIVFITAGLGGGTGSAAAVVITEILKSLNILTIGVVNTPFKVEGPRRNQIAQEAIDKLETQMDTLIVVPNDQIKIAIGVNDNKNSSISLKDAFKMGNNVLALAISSIINLTRQTGFINIDANDIKTTCSNMGLGVIASATCTGALRAKDSLAAAVGNPLLAPYELDKVGGIIVNITTDDNIKLEEYELIANMLNKYMSMDSKVTIGTSVDPSLAEEEMRLTLILTGIKKNTSRVTKEIDKSATTSPLSESIFKGKFKA
jgi:cell division protein FtsZ